MGLTVPQPGVAATTSARLRGGWLQRNWRGFLAQAALVAGLVATVAAFAVFTAANLKARGVPLGFDFLLYASRFIISESLLPFSFQDPVWWGIVVAGCNTLLVSVLVAGFSSVLGLLIGIGRLSANPLCAGACRVWVELARNTPPVLLLIFLYALWWKILPPVRAAWALAPGTWLSVRGLVMPQPTLGLPASSLATIVLAAVLAGLVVARCSRSRRLGAATALATTCAGVAYLWPGTTPFSVSWPRFDRGNFRGGMELTPELTTVVLGLTLYTTGFVAEIVRGGILSVPRGQWEAAATLGLSRARILRLVVVPQALRVSIPPLTSQYMNVVKNSTLAIAVGYPDFLNVMGTVINKSSHAVEGVLLIVAGYLMVNLALSAAMNRLNRRFAHPGR